jgi:hypothetical protein
MRFAFYLGLLVFVTAIQTVVASAQTDRSTLRPASAFSSISDPGERSRVIFAEAAKVLTHPRCLNCHRGRASRSERFASNSKTAIETAGAIWRCSTNISPTMTLWLRDCSRARDASPLQVAQRCLAS